MVTFHSDFLLNVPSPEGLRIPATGGMDHPDIQKLSESLRRGTEYRIEIGACKPSGVWVGGWYLHLFQKETVSSQKRTLASGGDLLVLANAGALSTPGDLLIPHDMLSPRGSVSLKYFPTQDTGSLEIGVMVCGLFVLVAGCYGVILFQHSVLSMYVGSGLAAICALLGLWAFVLWRRVLKIQKANSLVFAERRRWEKLQGDHVDAPRLR